MTATLTTIKGQIVAIQPGHYTVYIVEDLDRESNDEFKYISCTKTPNWNYSEEIRVGDKGYLQCEFVDAGMSKFYSNEKQEFTAYKYTNCYFINFVKMRDEVSEKEFKF